MVVEATWERERFHAQNYFATHPELDAVCVVGLDEVGRGALAGPVMVGAFALVLFADGSQQAIPAGIRDSKLLSVKRRESLFEQLTTGEYAFALGQASSSEIDDIGISPALSMAAQRAFEALPIMQLPPVAAVILDGNFDYFSRSLPVTQLPALVEVRIKADRDCMSVACASIVAKVSRDRLMTDFSATAPQYGWDKNKGYGGKAHKLALAEYGVHAQHRKSWNLGASPHQVAQRQTLAAVPDTQLSFDQFLQL